MMLDRKMVLTILGTLGASSGLFLLSDEEPVVCPEPVEQSAETIDESVGLRQE